MFMKIAFLKIWAKLVQKEPVDKDIETMGLQLVLKISASKLRDPAKILLLK